MIKKIQIATWNVQFCSNLADILTVIKTNKSFLDIDFLMLQEASLHDGKEDAKIIADILGKNYTYFQVTAQNAKGLPQANALIWNSQKIIVDTFDVLEMPPFHSSSRLHKHYKKIFDQKHFLAIFLKTIFQRRISLVLEGQLSGYSYRIYVVHFDILGLASKSKQMAFLLHDSIQRKKVDLEIIAGDINTFKYFNIPHWSGLINLTEQAGFRELTTDIQWTFIDNRLPMKFSQKHKLDAIFVRHKELFRFSSWSLDVPGSDHIPVFANITLP